MMFCTMLQEYSTWQRRWFWRFMGFCYSCVHQNTAMANKQRPWKP